MVFGLILFLALVVFVAVFVGFNLSNSCTIWLFHTYTDVPVAILVFGAFAAGIIISVIFVIWWQLRTPSKSFEKKVKEPKAPKAPKEKKEKTGKINKKKSLLKKAEKVADNEGAVITTENPEQNS